VLKNGKNIWSTLHCSAVIPSNIHHTIVRPGGVMDEALACDLSGREFNSPPLRCQGKLFTHIRVTKFNLVPVARQRCPATRKVTVGPSRTGHASQQT